MNTQSTEIWLLRSDYNVNAAIAALALPVSFPCKCTCPFSRCTAQLLASYISSNAPK